MSATIPRVSRPRGSLTDQERLTAIRLRAKAERAQDDYRNYVVQLLKSGRSFAEVSADTGLSTNTLQRWKREASA